MEAGLSLRRSPLTPSNEFEFGSRTIDTITSQYSRDSGEANSLENLDSADSKYETALTGDIDLQDRYVHRRPYVDRAQSHSKRRSQLIFEQKFLQQRSASAVSSIELDSAAANTPRFRDRPGTAPQRPSLSPRSPEFSFSHSDSPSRTINGAPGGGLRELATGSSAQPASKRASWIRRTREFEALSDSHHSSSSGVHEAASSVRARPPASRRHSSFLTGDYRSATLMPIIASNSFETTPNRSDKRRSVISYKSASSGRSPVLFSPSGLAAVVSSKRDSMQSTDSSATSSSKDEGLSAENVEFEGDDANQQTHSSASSAGGHEDSPAVKPATWQAQSKPNGQARVGEVYSTPRSSTEPEQRSRPPTAEIGVNDVKEDGSAAASKEAAGPIKDTPASANEGTKDADLLAAPAIPIANHTTVQTSVVPPSPTQPAFTEDSVSPTSSPVKTFRSLHATDGSASSPNGGSPFGSLSIPKGKGDRNSHLLATGGRRDSAASIGSASSSSTYRIRRKPVPSDADESERRERRPSHASGTFSDQSEFSPQPSPAYQDAPLPDVDNEQGGAKAIQHERNSNGNGLMQMAQEASQVGTAENATNGERRGSANGVCNAYMPGPAYIPTKSPRRPSTGPSANGLGSTVDSELSAAGTFASASSRDLQVTKGLGLGIPPPSTAATTSNPPTVTRAPSRATIKRPTTAPVGAGGQFRAASNGMQKSVLEVEGMSFVLGKEESKKATSVQDGTPSIPNAVRFLQHQRNGSGLSDAGSAGTRESMLRKSNSIRRRVDATSAKSANLNATNDSIVQSGSGNSATWGLEQELNIVDRARNGETGAPEPKPRASMDGKNRKTLDAATQSAFKNTMLMNIINEDESDEVKAAAREAGIPEGSYAIHPPSMLQLFEASQCLVYNQNGEEVIFGDLFKKRRTLVCFLRHWWCGFCQQFAMSVRNIDPLPLKKANLDFIIIGQGDWHVIKAYREVMQVPYPMFADPKRNVYRALGMTLRTNDANPVCARPDYASMGMTKSILVAIKKGLFDMPIRNPGDMKLLGGDFILGPGLQCSFTHRMTTADGHMDIPRILAQAGCDLSLKTPKPLFTVEEKESRAAMLAGGNQNRTRSLGRSKGKKASKLDSAVMDGSSVGHGSGRPSAPSIASSNARNKPSLWSRFPGRFSKSQASLPASGSMLDVSTDFGPARGLAAGPRSASAMRKISYDGRVRDSFETQQTDIEFESRATSFDTRGGRPSDVSLPAGGFGSVNKAQSMSGLRKRFEMGSSWNSKGRQEMPSAAKLSLESHLAVPGSGLKNKSSGRSLRNAFKSNGDGDRSGAATPTRASAQRAQQAEPVPALPNGAKSLAIFRNNVISKSDGGAQPTTNGLGIAGAGEESANGVVAAADDAAVPSKGPSAALPTMDMSAPGSFLMDLDVYDSLSRQPSQKYYNKSSAKTNGMLGPSPLDSGLSPSQTSDSHFPQEAADADSDTEPSMSANPSPARSARSTGNNGVSASGLPTTTGAGGAGFYSFGAFRGKTLGELPEEEAEEEEENEAGVKQHRIGDLSRSTRGEDDSEEDEEENDEPIEFEGGRSGGF